VYFIMNQTRKAATIAKTKAQWARPDSSHMAGRTASTGRSRFRKVHAGRIAPGAADQPVEKQLGDIDQHQAGQNLVGVEMRLEQRRDGGEHGAADGAHDQHQRQHQRRVPVVEHDRQDRTCDCAHGELAFGADVPVVGAIADRETDGDQDQRCRLDRQFMQRPDLQQRLDEEGVSASTGSLPSSANMMPPAISVSTSARTATEGRKALTPGGVFRVQCAWGRLRRGLAAMHAAHQQADLFARQFAGRERRSDRRPRR
jgi:hypothetical protein